VLCIYVFIVCATSGSEVRACHVYVKTSVLYITVAIFKATHIILKLAVTAGTEMCSFRIWWVETMKAGRYVTDSMEIQKMRITIYL
jgi:hypothetical protein